MTVFVALLGVLLVVGIGIAAEIVRSSTVTPASADAASLRAAMDRLASYEPMRRLFSAADEDLVQEADPGLGSRLQLARRKAMRLYLRQLRQDFMHLWSVCRMLAPVSQDQDFVVKLVRQLIQFHAMFFVLRVRTATGFWRSVDSDLERMSDMLSGLRAEGNGLLLAPAASSAGA